MGRALRRTVVAGGVIYLAGTTETAELAELVPNAKAWVGDVDAAPAPSVSSSKDVPEPVANLGRARARKS